MKKINIAVLFLLIVFFGTNLYSAGKKDEKILNGKILTVNKQHNFTIINLGKKDNVKKGMVFLVYREKKLIGKLEVEEAFKDMSSCLILPWINQEEVKKDDGVLKP